MVTAYKRQIWEVVASTAAITGTSLNSLGNGSAASGSGIALNADTTHLQFTCTFAFSTTTGLTDFEGPGLYIRWSSDGGSTYEPSGTVSKLPMSPIVFVGQNNTDVQTRTVEVERPRGATNFTATLVGRGGVALASSGNTLTVIQEGERLVTVEV